MKKGGPKFGPEINPQIKAWGAGGNPPGVPERVGQKPGGGNLGGKPPGGVLGHPKFGKRAFGEFRELFPKRRAIFGEIWGGQIFGGGETTKAQRGPIKAPGGE